MEHTSIDTLELLIRNIRFINESLDLSVVLDNIMTSALRVIPEADAGYFITYDEEKERLVPKTAIGFTEDVYQYEAEVGESIVGYVYSTQESIRFQTEEAIIQMMKRHQISERNFMSITASHHRVHALIAVPVFLQEAVIGVMIIHSWEEGKVFTEEDERLLQLYAEHAAVALRNALHYESKERSFQEIKSLSEALQQSNDTLRHLNRLHEQLMNLTLLNVSLPRFLNELQKMMQTPFLFYHAIEERYIVHDRARNVPLPSIQVEEEQLVQDIEMICQKGETYTVIPLRLDRALYGYFVVYESRRVAEVDVWLLEQARSLVMLELIKVQNERNIRHTFIADTFNKLMYEPSVQWLQLLKVDPNRILGSTLCIIGHTIVPRSIVEKLLKQCLDLFRENVLIAYVQHHHIVLWIGHLGEEEEKNIFRQLEQLVRLWESNRIRLSIGMSTSIASIEQCKGAYDEALFVTERLAKMNRGGVERYEEEEFAHLFRHLSQADQRHYVFDILSPLLQRDERSQELLHTLRIYIEENGQTSRIAHRLHVHKNTVYQRIEAIEQRLNIDLQHSDDQFKVMLALKLFMSLST